MKSGLGWIQTHIDRRSFTRGLVCVAAFYGAVFCILWLNQSATFRHLEEKLSAATVNIEYPAMTGVSHPPMPQSSATTEEPHLDGDILTEIEVDEVKAVPPDAHMSDVFPEDAKTPEESPAQPQNQDLSPLASAPIAELIEDTEQGALPKISSSGLTPFDAYKRPQASLGNTPVIALVVKDFGLSASLSEKLAATMPPAITFLISPYSNDAEEWQKKARAAGHEIWLELPMENRKFPAQDPGPLGILSDESLEYNKNALLSSLGTVSGYAGIAAHADESFVNSRLLLQNLLRMIFERGLGYFELNPDGLILIEDSASASEAPYARNGGIYDHADDNAFKEALSVAKNQGYAISTFEATPGNLEAMKEWVSNLEKAGVRLVPLSYIAQPPS